MKESFDYFDAANEKWEMASAGSVSVPKTSSSIVDSNMPD